MSNFTDLQKYIDEKNQSVYSLMSFYNIVWLDENIHSDENKKLIETLNQLKNLKVSAF